MKKNKEKRTVEMSFDEYQGMVAETEQLRQNLADQLEELRETGDELHTTKKQLTVLSKNLFEVKNLLHASVQLQTKAERTADYCVDTLKMLLRGWLTKENMSFVNNVLGFYYQEQRAKLLKAILVYLIFGKRTHLDTEVEKTHFEIICERLDEDAISLPAHSLMVKLMKKYGLFEEVFD